MKQLAEKLFEAANAAEAQAWVARVAGEHELAQRLEALAQRLWAEFESIREFTVNSKVLSE